MTAIREAQRVQRESRDNRRRRKKKQPRLLCALYRALRSQNERLHLIPRSRADDSRKVDLDLRQMECIKSGNYERIDVKGSSSLHRKKESFVLNEENQGS